jgi:ribosome recycling factor
MLSAARVRRALDHRAAPRALPQEPNDQRRSTVNQDGIIKETKQRFDKAITHLSELLRSIRTGRASSSLVDNIRVDYYGTPTPISQLATVSIPEPRQIAIKPFDASVLKEISKAIAKSDLGSAPQDDGKVVRITLPPLSGDQRQKFAAKVKELCEEARVSMRNVRRDMNKLADQLKKDGGLTEDQHKKVHDDVQHLLKEWEAKIDAVNTKKVAEIME